MTGTEHTTGDESNTDKPTWLIQARPRGMDHEPWRDLRVHARSALQGEAILRRRGYDVDMRTVRRVSGPGDPIADAVPASLECQRCGYHLDGVQVNAAIITCPECGFGQVVMVWRLEDEAKTSVWRILVAVLAIFGGLIVGLFAIGILSAIIARL